MMTRSGSSTEAVTVSALRQRMIAAMQMHGFSARTHESYLHWLPSAAEGEGERDLLAKLEVADD